MHIHTLELVPFSMKVNCTGCDIALRLATYDEAVMIRDEDTGGPNGPFLFNNGIVVVPTDFSVFQEA